MKPRTLILAAALAFAGCAASAERYGSGPAAETESTAEEYVREDGSPPAAMQDRAVSKSRDALFLDIAIDCGDRALGAYTVELRFNPEIVIIDRIDPAPADAFPGAPMSDPGAYHTGVARIVGLHAGFGTPPGTARIARVLFKPVSAGSSPVSLSILGLYDPAGAKINGAAVLSRHSIVSVP